jgi:ubiquinone/menaquinone biosynthesis C-methylase UbiE
LIITAPHTETSDFATTYHNLRRKEGRVYSDEEVAGLPGISQTHPHYREWQLRKRSCDKLIAYLRKKPSPLKILEAGCGNGWLSRHLATVTGSKVTGIDINISELRQAERVFRSFPNLRFMYGSLQAKALNDASFDIVVLAACIQYFPFVPQVIRSVSRLLNDKGEIHILDSPFYKQQELPAARQRTAGYYRDIGFPGMKDHYFHHKESDLEGFTYTVLYRPSLFSGWLLGNRNPFPWICIKKTGNIA